MGHKIDKKSIKTEAKNLIDQGKSKQEIYDELVDKYKYRNIIADIVRYTPEKEKLKKYSIWNTLYLILISILTILILLVQPTIGIIWLILLIVIVAMRKFKYYYWNTILGGATVITVFVISIYQGFVDEFEFNLTRIILALTLAAIFIIAGIMLPKKITPKYIEKKEKYVDKNGKERIRVIHLFE